MALTEWAIRRTLQLTLVGREARPTTAAPHNRGIEARSTAEQDSRPALTLRPLAGEDADALRRIHTTPEVARWWGAPSEGFPFTDDPEPTRLTIEVDGAVAGLIQFHEELEPKYRHATIDLFLDPAFRGRGLGAEALLTVVRHLFEERGHHRVTIDPALANAAAVRCYEKVGFRRVGVLRQYERGPEGEWRDGLLMDLLAGEQRATTKGP
jgi:aminoglycoside 6'-N-acetyltransferase